MLSEGSTTVNQQSLVFREKWTIADSVPNKVDSKWTVEIGCFDEADGLHLTRRCDVSITEPMPLPPSAICLTGAPSGDRKHDGPCREFSRLLNRCDGKLCAKCIAPPAERAGLTVRGGELTKSARRHNEGVPAGISCSRVSLPRCHLSGTRHLYAIPLTPLFENAAFSSSQPI